MSDPRDYQVELRSTGAAEGDAAHSAHPAIGSGASAAGGRPFLSVHFACCGVYQRVYRSRDGKTYDGRCPRCAAAVRFVVGEGGTGARRFVVR